MSTGASALRLGTRGSALARWQAEWVAAQLRTAGHLVELIEIVTQGDVDQIDPIGQIGITGVFTKELQRALMDGRIDVAVHSLKDLPTDVIPGLSIAAVPERASPLDVLVSRGDKLFGELPPGAILGTGSQRRRAQLLCTRKDVTFADIRGNVGTRLDKLDRGEYDALVLAEAGLRRLGLAERISQVFSPSVMLPAVAQGALGIEIRSDDAATRALVAPLDHEISHQAIAAERSLLSDLQGGCLAPIGAWAKMAGANLRLLATVVAADGSRRLWADIVGEPQNAVELGKAAASQLLAAGAAQMISQARRST